MSISNAEAHDRLYSTSATSWVTWFDSFVISPFFTMKLLLINLAILNIHLSYKSLKLVAVYVMNIVYFT